MSYISKDYDESLCRGAKAGMARDLAQLFGPTQLVSTSTFETGVEITALPRKITKVVGSLWVAEEVILKVMGWDKITPERELELEEAGYYRALPDPEGKEPKGGKL